jgi:tetratricopeptide (TPR) repeat protein
MLWWLSVPPRAEPPRGVLRLKPWLGAAEATQLAEALAALLPGPLPVMALPLRRLCAEDAALKRLAAVIVVELPDGEALPPRPPPQSVLVAWGPGGEASPTRPLRELLLMVLQLSLAQGTHPLNLLGAGPWLEAQLARRAAEPEELLDLLDRAVAHRRDLPDQHEAGWARSVEHAAGAHVAARLRRLPPDERWALLRVLVGLGEPAEGLLAGERAGLLHLSEDTPTVTAVARGLMDGEARGGLLSGLDGEPLPDDLRAALLPPAPTVVSGPSLTPSVAVSTLLTDTVRAWLGDLSGAQDGALLTRGLETLALAERAAHYSDAARLGAVGPVVLALRSAARGAGGDVAGALAELIVLTAAWLPADEDTQAEALEALRRLYTQGGIPQSVWAAALLRRAERLLSAPQATDMRADAVGVLREVATVGAKGRLDAERLRLEGALALAHGAPEEALAAYQAAAAGFGAVGDTYGRAATLGRIADVLQTRGQLDEALRIRREEELPVYEQLGDVHGEAVTMGQIADVLQARGQLDEALRIWREEVLPVFEQLGDVLSKAATLGRIADVLQARGQLDEALRIRREEELPVYERLGDVLRKALTMGRIADVHQARGQLDEALRIRREEELPVYERLGDVRERAITLSKIADVHQARGQLDEALRIRREEVLPVIERLSDRRELCVGRAHLAIILLQRGHTDDLAEARALLLAAEAVAAEMNLPRELAAIRSWLPHAGLPT